MAKGDSSKWTLKMFDSSSVFTDVNRISFKLAKENTEFRPHCLTWGTPNSFQLIILYFYLYFYFFTQQR